MDVPTRKFSIGGLKLSLELVQIRLLPSAGLTGNEMLGRLADHQINLFGVALDAADGQLAGICCLSEKDRLTAMRALRPFEGSYEMLSPVGALTIFPIQARLALMARLVAVLGTAGLPIYGMVSSLSSFTITTEYQRLDEAVSAVCQVVILPDNHAPFRPEFHVRQL
jgi:hypothetical protein